MPKDIDDLLDDRMTSGSGDYPPWMNEDGDDDLPEGPIQGEGDILQGEVVGRRDDPWHGDDDEGEPDPILHVEDDDGNVWSTRTHSILVNLIDEQDVEIGDVVRIEHAGNFKTDTGQVANDYRLGVVKAEELEDDETEATADGGLAAQEPEEDTGFDVSEATVDEIEEYVQTVDDKAELVNLKADEEEGQNRKTAKEVINERANELDSGVPNDALEFAESLLSFHEELDYEELDQYLNETRDLGVLVEDVVEELEDVTIDGDTVRKDE